MSKQTKDQEQEYRLTFRGLLDLYLPYKTSDEIYSAIELSCRRNGWGVAAEQFEYHLCDICKRLNDEKENPAPWRFAVVNATAAQRAEAFLRTIGKWEGAK